MVKFIFFRTGSLVSLYPKDQYAIGFSYDYTHQEPSEGQNKEYMDPVMDILKRKFGNDLVGWDIASPVWIIK
ncbi:MAG: hypothetical protein A3B86_00655 [Candidatus Yanofskybacteria bacterium RIFCSPHIGHO2_02_FULL_38_22b]|uniref:Uncharacterized protein n=1 Tax=Candidatus Yanofskybacteria bacterium RIFCSPHIGHO2_02_FULL_38_22b TaxID=1802673 RepID=A0A1F8F4Q7_9BACT|nr:MAG: hypothetical protein A2816_03610 [Candidatus Yanofskybacteria bacterium RIFCSPHIGHO2_01_FULL_39_44]OGN07590.1 MAG: hypothetical protein A3B86_00655 [Candidatus Yanofskybacteria bacterium RIFCSPHIGHO2_02_FULL_38_22b]OGN20219.1 MAG: hypothetical protein A2910_00190 [Candidatus Yanofskybacteria bacterium RIFCSPLOWO2_01_FULL_39_28]